MGLVGIMLGLALLIWLAYRGWSVLLVGPLAALLAAAFARDARAAVGKAADDSLHDAPANWRGRCLPLHGRCRNDHRDSVVGRRRLGGSVALGINWFERARRVIEHLSALCG